MKNIILIVVALLTVRASDAASPTVAPAQKKEEIFVINGVIAEGNILPIGKRMIELSHKIDHVSLVINSPGGEITTGFLFLSLMREAQANGLVVNCFVPTIAASMAFHIFLHCNNRVALDKSFLLWHRARVQLGGGLMSPGVTMTSVMAQQLSEDLGRSDLLIFQDLVRFLTLPTDIISKHFEQETLHTGKSLAFLAPQFMKSFEALPGLLETLIKAMTKQGPAQDRSALKDNQIVYIMEQELETKLQLNGAK